MSEKHQLFIDISIRAEEMNILAFDRRSLIMDLDCAADEFDLRLNDLLKADNFNFAHDIVGIQNHIDRQTGKMSSRFLPRFASHS